MKYPTHSFTTDANGSYTVSGLEWDTYASALTNAAYDLAGTSLMPVFDVNAGENKAVQMIVTPHLDKALLVSVVDGNGAAIDGALVVLQKTPFSDTKTTNGGTCATPGQVFWNGLASGTYSLTVSKTGYATSVTSVSLSSSWQNPTITLAP